MERDKQLKEILEKGAEKASANFTASVMAGVHALSSKPFVYRSLVPAAAQRIFLIAFSSVIVLIFIACLFITAPEMSFMRAIKLPDISPETYQKMISSILIFWIVFTINKVLTKNSWKVVNREP